MGFLAKYLRARPGKGGGPNFITDKREKAKFAAEIEAMCDPVQREAELLKQHETLVLKSCREPTIKEVLAELARQATRVRARHPGRKLVCYCGGYAFALLAQVRSYPEVTMGMDIKMDNHIPPWDTVVMLLTDKEKQRGRIL